MQKFLLKILLIFSDIFWLMVLYFVAYFIRKHIPFEGLPEFSHISLGDFYFVIVIVVLIFYYEKIYTLRYDFWQDTLKVYQSLVISFFIVLSILALTKTNLHYSRFFMVLYFFLAFATLPVFKRFVKRLLFKYDCFRDKVLVVGRRKEEVIRELKENWYLGTDYDEGEYNRVIILSDGYTTKKLSNLIDMYLLGVSEVYVAPYLADINFLHSNILEYSNIRLNTIGVENRLLIRKNIIIKNIFDKVVGWMIFPLFISAHIVLSFLIVIDSRGKVLFRQKRLGRDGKAFTIYKYRTMYTNSDELLQKYLLSNPDEVEYYKKYHKYKNDPRVTKIGKFLRSTSLDELPQILNILKGEMSFVGPRPYMIDEKEKLQYHKEFILKVKPGITGLWQVSGRNNLTFQKRIELETWYIKNWSLWADIVILLKTKKVVFSQDGAR